MKARIRAKVEHPFRVVKRQFGHVKVRYRGLAKNTAQLHTLFALANLAQTHGSCGMSASAARQIGVGGADSRRQWANRRS